jgi:hypothetical protein
MARWEHPDDRDFHYSSESEWDRAEARELGRERPDLAWVCTDRDVWHRNPYYQGPSVPHPEEADYAANLAGEPMDTCPF